MIRLYLDEDTMDRRLVRALRARGVDVETAVEIGMIERSDQDHLIHATNQGRVLCTFNVGDFCRLHAEFMETGKTHAGIVVALQQRYDIGERMRRLLHLIAAKTADDMRNRLEFLSDW